LNDILIVKNEQIYRVSIWVNARRIRLKVNWKGPTVQEIAVEAGVSRATVDRVLNTREEVSVRESTRRKVLEAIDRLSMGGKATPADLSKAKLRILFIVESGVTFSKLLGEAIRSAQFLRNDVEIECLSSETNSTTAQSVSDHIYNAENEGVDGIVLVAPEDPIITRAVQEVVMRGCPVVCFTTDLPNSKRTAYVGVDQTAAGSTAAYFMGRMLPTKVGRVLMVVSAPYRGLEERELGFRRVIRSEFPELQLEERVNSQDDSEFAYQRVLKYLRQHEDVVAIYNAAGGNSGIAKALIELGKEKSIIFIGHELSDHTRALLESGVMDLVLGHDFLSEVLSSVSLISSYHSGDQVLDQKLPLLLYNRYSSF
jgi:LacI family transcriptional regulator